MSETDQIESALTGVDMIEMPEWKIIIVYTRDTKYLGPRGKAYEERVRVAVNAISRSIIGRVLLKTLRDPQYNPDAKLWIMPYHHADCESKTGPYLTPDPATGRPNYEGIRILFSPDTWRMDACGWTPGLRPEETLFHEMVHASRYFNDNMYDDTPLGLMVDYEEFLAVLITNMYRSELGAKKFHRDYTYKLPVEQAEAELFLSSKRMFVDALRSLLTDPLVQAVVGMPMPYNPFRDFARIAADYSAIREILADINEPSETARLKAIGKKLSELRDMSIDSSSRAMQKLP